MRSFSSAVIAVAAMLSSPLAAAPLHHSDGTRAAAFAGGRIILPFGGPGSVRPRASLTLAPTFVRQDGHGVRHHYGQGVELGFQGRDPRLSAGGLSLLGGGDTRRDDRLGLSTLGTAGVVLAGVAVIGGAILAVQVAEANKNSD